MASIVKRTKQGKPVYHVVFRNPEGRQVWKKAGNRRIDAEKLKAQIENDVFKGIYQEIPDVGMKEFSEKWLEAKKGDVRLQTYLGYKGHFKHKINPYFGNRMLKSITTEEIEKFKGYLAECGISPATIAKYLLTLKMALKTAVIWGYLVKNPAEYVKRPHSNKYQPSFLTYDEMRKLIEATPIKHKTLIATAAFTGVRLGELLALKWDDVDFTNRRIFIHRTLQQGKFYDPKAPASRRAIDIPSFLIEILKEHQLRQAYELSSNELGLVFVNEDGKIMDKSNVENRIFKPALRLAGLSGNIRFHDLRHSFASMLIHQGGNIKYVQKVLGHSNISMTLGVYAHLLPDAGSEVIDKIDSMFISKDSSKMQVEMESVV